MKGLFFLNPKPEDGNMKTKKQPHLHVTAFILKGWKTGLEPATS